MKYVPRKWARKSGAKVVHFKSWTMSNGFGKTERKRGVTSVGRVVCRGFNAYILRNSTVCPLVVNRRKPVIKSALLCRGIRKFHFLLSFSHFNPSLLTETEESATCSAAWNDKIVVFSSYKSREQLETKGLSKSRGTKLHSVRDLQRGFLQKIHRCVSSYRKMTHPTFSRLSNLKIYFRCMILIWGWVVHTEGQRERDETFLFGEKHPLCNVSLFLWCQLISVSHESCQSALTVLPSVTTAYAATLKHCLSGGWGYVRIICTYLTDLCVSDATSSLLHPLTYSEIRTECECVLL